MGIPQKNFSQKEILILIDHKFVHPLFRVKGIVFTKVGIQLFKKCNQLIPPLPLLWLSGFCALDLIPGIVDSASFLLPLSFKLLILFS